MVLFGTPVRPPWARLRQMTAAGIGRDIYHLTRPDIVLGREQGDIVFSDDEFLSRRHAQVAIPERARPHAKTWAARTELTCACAASMGWLSGDMIRMGDELCGSR